jgi:hypothetical protein
MLLHRPNSFFMAIFEKYTYSDASITREITTVYFEKWYHSSPNLFGKN